MPARNNAASIGCSKRRNREAEPLGASASLEATDQKRSPYRPVSASREPVSGAIGSVTSGVRVCTGKSMMKHGETKQSQQSPLLTPGAPGANTDGHVTAFFNIDRLPSSPGDEKSSTSAEQCRRAECRDQCLEPRLDINGPGRGTEDQSIKGSSDAAPFSGTFVPIMNPTNPSESSVAEPAKDVRSADSVVSPGAGLSLSASVPTSGIAGIGPLTKPT